MTVPHFTSVVRYRNELLLPTELYPPIDAPAGVPVWQPLFAAPAEMVTLAQGRRDRYGYATEVRIGATPSGYVLSDLDLRFVDFESQWRFEQERWRYQGGEIRLELTLTIYADEGARDRPNCLSMILTHELAHVGDEIDIVGTWLPVRAPIDLGSRFSPLGESTFQRSMRGEGDGRGSGLERAVQGLWVEESGRRANALHESRPQDEENIRSCLGRGPARR